MPPSVAILITAHKKELSPFEKHSLIQCQKVLGAYPIFFICPKGLDVGEYPVLSAQVHFDFISPRWQKNYRNYLQLKMRPFLYNRYKRFEYLMFFEPDAFVFRNELTDWMNAGYDNIGAPWQEGQVRATPDAPFIGAGNGGFALRRVAAFRKAMYSFGYLRAPKELIARWWDRPFWMKVLKFPGLILDFTLRNNTFFLLNHYTESEDTFWGKYVPRAHPWFRVAPPEVALRFSFETNPRTMYARNNHELPFGCHAWWRYDLEFWKPFIRPPEHPILNPD